MQSIGAHAFGSCPNLEIVYFQNNSHLKNINENAFSKCDNLVAVIAQSTLDPVVRAAVPEGKLILR